jgi:hypothetical protein
MTKLDSEFVDAFDWAVIRLATYVPQSAPQSRLLFGSVSLLTKDRRRPDGGYRCVAVDRPMVWRARL